MRYFILSLAVFAGLAGNSRAQESAVVAPGAPPADGIVPEAPQATATGETLEQRVQRLEAQLAEAKAAAGQVNPAADGSALPPAGPAPAVDNSWRYKRHNGAWWYWLPSNRWVYWSNGAWVDYVAGAPVVVATPSFGVRRDYGYSYPYTSRYHSHYPTGVGVYIGIYGLGHHHHGYGGYGHAGHGHVGHGHLSHGHIGHGGHGHGHGHGGGHGHH